MSSAFRLAETQAGPGKPAINRGVIERAPVNEHDSLLVSLFGYSSDHAYHVPSGQWSPKGTALPAVGTTCLVEFDAEGDAWVTEWQGLSTFPTGSGRVFVQNSTPAPTAGFGNYVWFKTDTDVSPTIVLDVLMGYA